MKQRLYTAGLQTENCGFWGDATTYVRNGNTNCTFACKITGRQFIKLSSAIETPTLGTPLNGNNGLEFSPSRALIGVNSTAWFNGLHQGNGMIYMVSRHNSFGTNAAWFDNCAGASNKNGIFLGNGAFRLVANRSSVGSMNVLTPSDIANETTYVHTFRVENNARYWRNGNSIKTETFSTWATGIATHNMRIGDVGATLDSSAITLGLPNGNVLYELAIFNRVHTTEEIAQWHNYLKTKYNL